MWGLVLWAYSYVPCYLVLTAYDHHTRIVPWIVAVGSKECLCAPILSVDHHLSTCGSNIYIDPYSSSLGWNHPIHINKRRRIIEPVTSYSIWIQNGVLQTRGKRRMEKEEDLHRFSAKAKHLEPLCSRLLAMPAILCLCS